MGLFRIKDLSDDELRSRVDTERYRLERSEKHHEDRLERIEKWEKELLMRVRKRRAEKQRERARRIEESRRPIVNAVNVDYAAAEAKACINLTGMSDGELRAEITRAEKLVIASSDGIARAREDLDDFRCKAGHAEAELRAHSDNVATSRSQLEDLRGELNTRRRKTIEVPHWVFEILSAHARKRFENIACENRTDAYEAALSHAARLLCGEVWPRDVEGEHHGSTPGGSRRLS